MDHRSLETLSKGITRVIQQKGADIVKDKRLFLACLKDECPELDNKTKNVLGVVVEYDAFELIQKTPKSQIEAAIISLASKMSDEYGLDLNLCENVVDAIAYYYGKSSGILFCEKKATEKVPPEPAQQVREKTEPKPQPQSSVQSTQNMQQQTSSQTPQTYAPVAPKDASNNVKKQRSGWTRTNLFFASLITFGFGILAIVNLVAAVKGEMTGLGAFGKNFSRLSLVVMAIRAGILYDKAAKNPNKNNGTKYEFILWIISLLDIGVFFFAERVRSVGGVLKYIAIVTVFVIVLVGGWRYFRKVFGWGQVKSGSKVKTIIRVIYIIVSSLFTVGLIALDVGMICAIPNEEIYLFFESDNGVLLKNFARNALLFMVVRSIVMWIVGGQYPDEDENTTYGVILWILSMLGIGGFFYAFTHVPCIGTWQYVVIVAAFLIVVIGEWVFFHNAVCWDYENAIMIVTILGALFVLYIIIASCIPCFGKTHYSEFILWNIILAVFDIVWGIIKAAIAIIGLVIGGGYWMQNSYSQFWIAGPWLNTIFYMLIATWFSLVMVENS